MYVIIPPDADKFWAFEQLNDVVELKKDYAAGLLHSLEFADKIIVLAEQHGLIEG